MFDKNMDKKQLKILSFLTIIAVLLTAYFFRGYFGVIALAAIVAYLSNPIYKFYLRKTRSIHVSLWLVFLTTLVVVIIPIGLVVMLTISQSIELINNIINGSLNLTPIINTLNSWLNKLPFDVTKHINSDFLVDWLKNNIGTISKSTVSIVLNLVGGISTLVVKIVIFIYVYLAFLKHQGKIVKTLKNLDPLGNKTTDLYLTKMGAMTSAMVKGQLVIALLQGLIDATLLWLVGIDYFIFWFVLISFLSFIPLGGGVFVLPLGVIMILTGNVWQGILLIAGHILVVTNIDNVLRPIFVPKEADIEPALTMLAVFSGIAMFGFLGIVIGPVFVIILMTTIQVYLQSIKKNKSAGEKSLDKPAK